MGQTILLTRPQAESEHLSLRLRRLGFSTLVMPMMRIEATHVLPPVAVCESVIFTSANGVKTLATQTHDFLLELDCYCVGRRTAAAARQLGFKKVSFTESDSSALAWLITQQSPKGTKFWHITGKHTARDAFSDLRTEGYAIETWPIYEAVAADTLNEEVVAAIRDHSIYAAIFYSSRTASIMIELAVRQHLVSDLREIHAIGLSQPVADMLNSVNWRRVVSASAPNKNAVIQSLLSIPEVS